MAVGAYSTFIRAFPVCCPGPIGDGSGGTEEAPSLHYNGQIHAWVQRAINVVGACRRKGPDHLRPSGDVDSTQDWRSQLGSRMWDATCVPRSVLQDMFHGTVTDDEQA